MSFLEELPDRARAFHGHVVLVEGDDPRIVEAAEVLCPRENCKGHNSVPRGETGPLGHDRLGSLGCHGHRPGQ